MNRDGGPIAAQSQLNPTPCQLSPLVASAGKQPRNRMQNHTCLQRRAGVRAHDGNRGYGQPKGDERAVDVFVVDHWLTIASVRMLQTCLIW